MKSILPMFLKTRSIKTLLVAICVGICFSRCIEPTITINPGSAFLGSGGNYNFTDMPLGVGLTIDSVIDIKANSVTLTFKVSPLDDKDPIIVLQETTVTKWKIDPTGLIGGPMRKFSTGPDTVDFRKKNPFVFQLKIDSLARGTKYQFYVTRDYSSMSKSNSQKTSTSCIPRNNSCTYIVQTIN